MTHSSQLFAFCGRLMKEPLGRSGLPFVLSAVAFMSAVASAKEKVFLAFVASTRRRPRPEEGGKS